MSQEISLPDAARFGLASFADILPARDPILGEDPGSFEGFHEGMMRALAPATPYECVIAENLIAIEWEHLQQRRMRDAGLRQVMRKAIREAVVDEREYLHEEALDEAWVRHQEAGGTEEDWKEPLPSSFDREAAEIAGDDLADRAVSRDRDVQAAAYKEIEALGMEPVEVMAEAYRDWDRAIGAHDGRVRALEGRRREVKRDLDALQKARPVEAQVIDA